MPERKMLGLEEAASLLKINPRTLRNWIYADKYGIQSVVRKIGGNVLFWEDDFIAWIDSHRLKEEDNE